MAFARKKGAKRFSLLLLEDEEDYVADWVATCRWPDSVDGNWHKQGQLTGRLRLCTKSLFFDPDDLRIPIVRLPFAAMQRLEAEGARTFVLAVSALTKMRTNMEDAPYVSEKGKVSSWVFELAYAGLDSFMPLAQEQLVASRLPPSERTQLLVASVRAREDAASFDSSRLHDFAERVLWEGPATQLTPLVREPGRLALSDQRLYFQPLHNVAGDVPVRGHPLAGVAAVVKRRAALQPIGMEVFFVHPGAAQGSAGGLPVGPTWDGPSAFFSFRTADDRDRLVAAITAQQCLGEALSGSSAREAAGHLLEASGGWLNRVVVAWQRGTISNFDYLLYLNFAAGRSFNDLAQWPVFPWVLSDYTSASVDLSDPKHFRDLSKPVGALEPVRLEVFRQRYRELAALNAAAGGGSRAAAAGDGDHADGHAADDMQPFMYGTHYSTPGYVMYWLVRGAPAHMLRLQGGRFDAPDRLFCSMAESWESVLRSTTDVKELIPEFYMPGSDFLTNGARLALGIRQNGRAVGDVELPPWASCPDVFLATMRAALEAPYVSQHLHSWIDLVFGHKQTGPAAVEANNVFYHLTYEGAVDVSKVKDPLELKALELQINEFGQTPKQLFTHPHPARHVAPPAVDPPTVLGAGTGAADGGAASAKGRLRGGGEDAGGRALALALMSTIMAAAAPEVQGEAQQQHAHQQSLLKLPQALAQQATMQPNQHSHPHHHQQPDGPQQLEEQPSQHSAAHAGDGQAAAAFGSSTSTPADARVQAVSPQPDLQGADVGGLSGRFKGYMSMLSDGVGSASSAIRSRMSSSQVDVGLPSESVGSLPLAGHVGEPTDGTARVAATAGVSDAVTATPSTGGTGTGGGSKLSLAWVQQQFARSPSPASMALGSPATAARQMAPASITHTGAPSPSSSGTTGAALPLLGAPPASTTTAYQPPQTLQTPIPPGSAKQAPQPPWPRGMPDQMLIQRSVRLHKEPVTAVALDPATSSTAYCTTQDGLVRAMALPDLTTHRQAKLQEELLCLCLLQHTAGTGRHGIGPAATSSTGVSHQQPIMLAGSHTGKVFAYSPEAGRSLGDFVAHDDAVSCIMAVGANQARLASASWDCSVRLWDVAEGRQPWDSPMPVPASSLRDHESGVWALAGSSSGQLLVAGTEEGVVAAWDVRTQQRVWAVQVSSDYIGGLSILPGGAHVAVASADGSISLLEWRRAGDVQTRVQCGAPLRCCTCDGRLVVAGTETGQLQLWDVAQMLGQEVTAGFMPAGPDGLYAPLRCESRAPVNAVAIGVTASAEPEGHAGKSYAVAAQEDGTVALFST